MPGGNSAAFDPAPCDGRRRGRKQKEPARASLFERPGRARWMIPAMSDFRALGTIMGPAGLTAVFGMGTGGTPPVSSPEIARPGDQPGRTRWIASDSTAGRTRVWWWSSSSGRGPRRVGDRYASGWRSWPGRAASVRGGDESGWSSRSAVRTGRLRRSPVVHSRPIDLVVFQEPSHHLVPETSS